MTTPDDQTSADTTLTIDQAAEALGIKPAAVRRRIRKGELDATLVPGIYGLTYRVTLPYPRPTPDDHREPAALPQLQPLVDMLKEKDQTILELSGRLGFVMAENQHLKDQVALLAGGPIVEEFSIGNQSAPASKATPARSPWLRRLFGWWQPAS